MLANEKAFKKAWRIEMLYKILKPFGPSAGAEWEDYLS